MTSPTSSDSPGTLEFYWFPIDPEDETSRYWGQLAGSITRLWFIVDEMEALLLKDENLATAIRRLQYHMENYLYRIYEHRERIVKLLSKITGRNLSTLKDPEGRARALQTVELATPHLLPPLKRILQLLDEDILLRNRHTHRNFLSLGLHTESGIYDPCDLLEIDRPTSPEEGARLEENLRREIRRISTEYADFVARITKESQHLLRAAEADIF